MTTLKYAVMLLLGAAAVAVASTPPPPPATQPTYAFECTAVQKGDTVLVAIKITLHLLDHSKHSPEAKTVVVASPRIVLADGQRGTLGTLQVGSSQAPTSQPAAGTPGIPDVTEEVRVDVVKPLGQNTVIALITVIKQGKVVFAEAQNVVIAPEPAPDTASAPATRPAQ